MTPSLRAGAVLSGFLAMTLPLMPVQAAAVRLPFPRARVFSRRFPNWYHRRVCDLVGIRIEIEGRLDPEKATLILANHVSWLDIPVLSAVGPVSFVAKREVATWPFVSALARLQRTIFVDRERRMSVAGTAGEIGARLEVGDHIVLFAEGTSNDGNRVLPFRSALLGSLFGASGLTGELRRRAPNVQTLAIAYTRQHGMAMDRFQRPDIAWYGDMELPGHAWRLLAGGPLDVKIRIGEPLSLAEFANRKALARYGEARIRADVADMLRNRAQG